MSNNSTQRTPAKPTHHAYQVRDTAAGSAFWNRIGAAWANADGQGFNIQLESVPIDGRITLRVATAKQQD